MIAARTVLARWGSAGLGVLFALTASRVEAQVCSPTLFIEAASYSTGGNARAVAAGDFNGDTRPDIAAANVNPRGVAILLNDGNGGLEAPIVTPLNDDPVAIAAVDLRGNGTTDVIAATYNGIYVLLGHGDGTFDAPVFYAADNYSISSMVVGKFDANGTWDVALGSFYSDDIALFPGNGNGTFGAPLHTVSLPPVVSMTSGDFNGDGHLDIAFSTGSAGVVEVLPGVGDGTFGAASSFIAGASLGGIVAADFNDDGHLDIAVGSGMFVSILLGDGAGGFQAALQYSAGIAAGALAVGDLDQDGIPDLAAAEFNDFYNGNGNEVSVLRGLGDGSFAPGEVYSSAGASAIALADLDGDSLPDVVTAGGTISVLRDAPDGNLLAVPNSPLEGPGYQSLSFARGDWNGDGLLDFAWVYGNQVLVIEGQPGGRFAQTGALDMPNFNQPVGVAAGDFFGDSIASLVVTTFSDVLLFRGNGDGTFQPPVSIFNGSQLGPIATGNFDGINGSDVVIGQGCCGFGNIVLLLGNGDGTFQPPLQTPVPSDVYFLLPADFTLGFPQPGHPATDDLAISMNGSVQVMLNNGDGTFFATTTIPTPGVVATIATGDFAGSGLDLLVSAGSASVSLYPGNDNGTFGSPTTIALQSPAQSLATGYYDSDANADFAALSNGGILVFLGLGNGHFQSPLPLSTDVSASFVTTADFEDSGAQGLAAIGPDGIAAFRNSRVSAFVSGPYSVLVGSSVSLRAGASGYGPLTYQWRWNGTPLADGGPISGAQTSILTIGPGGFTDAGDYDVVVTDSCDTATSASHTLSVEFADVPFLSPFHDDIITIATAGITGGCGGSDYCPTSPVQRDQMAVFLLKSEHGSAYTPPACTGVFTDVPCPGLFTDWVEQLSAEGITGGCGGGNYCPDSSVTRAQMAIFLLKTSEGSSYTPPTAVGIFGDVPVGSFGADFIEDLYNRGITGGCQLSPLLYCPGNSVLRQQMATFLVRTFFP